MARRPLARRMFRGFALLAASGVVVAAALLGSLWLERRSELTLPTPTGPFAVGRAVYDWKDDAHVDALAPVPGTRRELLVWIWYPSAAGPSAAIDDYVPAWMRAAVELPPGLLGFLTRDLSKVHGHSARDADLSPRPRSFPVVIMRAGASALVVSYSTLAEDLASHGYVVVGFDAPYRTFDVAFPDGRVMSRPPENDPELCEDQPPARQARCVSRFLTAWTADVAFTGAHEKLIYAVSRAYFAIGAARGGGAPTAVPAAKKGNGERANFHRKNLGCRQIGGPSRGRCKKKKTTVQMIVCPPASIR